MPNNDTQQIVNRAWNFAHMLRDDGPSYLAQTGILSLNLAQLLLIGKHPTLARKRTFSIFTIFPNPTPQNRVMDSQIVRYLFYGMTI